MRRPFRKPTTQFEVRSASDYGACKLIAAVTAANVAEGLKAVAARQSLGLTEPKIEGKPLSSFLKAELSDPSEILTLSLLLGRRAGLGAYWIGLNLWTAPDEACVSDEAFADELRRCIEPVEE